MGIDSTSKNPHSSQSTPLPTLTKVPLEATFISLAQEIELLAPFKIKKSIEHYKSSIAKFFTRRNILPILMTAIILPLTIFISALFIHEIYMLIMLKITFSLGDMLSLLLINAFLAFSTYVYISQLNEKFKNIVDPKVKFHSIEDIFNPILPEISDAIYMTAYSMQYILDDFESSKENPITIIFKYNEIINEFCRATSLLFEIKLKEFEEKKQNLHDNYIKIFNAAKKYLNSFDNIELLKNKYPNFNNLHKDNKEKIKNILKMIKDELFKDINASVPPKIPITFGSSSSSI